MPLHIPDLLATICCFDSYELLLRHTNAFLFQTYRPLQSTVLYVRATAQSGFTGIRVWSRLLDMPKIFEVRNRSIKVQSAPLLAEPPTVVHVSNACQNHVPPTTQQAVHTWRSSAGSLADLLNTVFVSQATGWTHSP